jgi:putative metalloenzyme radical SAM/SPASM domain maturase
MKGLQFKRVSDLMREAFKLVLARPATFEPPLQRGRRGAADMNRNSSAASDRPHPLSSPSLLPHPSKLFVETTTRCNLGCFMCVKQTCDHAIIEGDMSLATFAALEPAFPGLKALVLNGLGEPLLHPDLNLFIRRAKTLMPKESWVGFQSNALLLTECHAVSLLEAGLDRICLSIGSVSPETFRKVRDGGELDDISAAFSDLASARVRTGRAEFKIGVEFVVMQGNLQELPAALAWAGNRGAIFALVTHVLPYDARHAVEALYGNCTDEAVLLFARWKSEAEREGIDIYRYFEVAMKYFTSAEEQRLIDMVDALKAEAERHNIFLDLEKLLSLDCRQSEEVAAVFRQARGCRGVRSRAQASRRFPPGDPQLQLRGGWRGVCLLERVALPLLLPLALLPLLR